MSEESTTPDLVELSRRTTEAANNRDFDSLLSWFATDAVWDVSQLGLGTYEGLAKIRGFAEDWFGSYAELVYEEEEVVDLGNGTTFTVVHQDGRLVGSTGHVELRFAQVAAWANGLVVRVTIYTDIDEARAAAERLAESRG